MTRRPATSPVEVSISVLGPRAAGRGAAPVAEDEEASTVAPKERHSSRSFAAAAAADAEAGAADPEPEAEAAGAVGAAAGAAPVVTAFPPILTPENYMRGTKVDAAAKARQQGEK